MEALLFMIGYFIGLAAGFWINEDQDKKEVTANEPK
jgi:hypothetical protein